MAVEQMLESDWSGLLLFLDLDLRFCDSECVPPDGCECLFPLRAQGESGVQQE